MVIDYTLWHSFDLKQPSKSGEQVQVSPYVRRCGIKFMTVNMCAKFPLVLAAGVILIQGRIKIVPIWVVPTSNLTLIVSIGDAPLACLLY